MRDSSRDLPANGSPEPKRETEEQNRPREGLQWPQEERSPPLPLSPDGLAARGRLSHGRLFAFSACVSGGSLPSGPGCGAHSRRTVLLPPLSAAAPVGSRQPPDPFIFPFFPPRSGAEPRSVHPYPPTHSPAPKSSAASTHPPRKGRFDRGGHGYVRVGDKNKAGKEGGGLGNLGAERGKHAECPHLGSAFEAASFRSEQDIFKVQLEVCVYPGHLAGISWRQRRPRCAPLRCAAPPAELGRPKPAGRARSLFIGRGERGAAAGPHRFIRSGLVSAVQPAAPSPPSLFPCVAGEDGRGRGSRPQIACAGRGASTAAGTAV